MGIVIKYCVFLQLFFGILFQIIAEIWQGTKDINEMFTLCFRIASRTDSHVSFILLNQSYYNMPTLGVSGNNAL